MKNSSAVKTGDAVRVIVHSVAPELLPSVKRNSAMEVFRTSNPEKYFWKKNLLWFRKKQNQKQKQTNFPQQTNKEKSTPKQIKPKKQNNLFLCMFCF